MSYIKGTIKNERLGIEAPFEVTPLPSRSYDYIYGTFEGHSKKNLFYVADGWKFEEAKPSLYDEVEALTPGTIFTISKNHTAPYVRADEGYRSIYEDGTGPVNPIPGMWKSFYDYTVTPIYVRED